MFKYKASVDLTSTQPINRGNSRKVNKCSIKHPNKLYITLCNLFLPFIVISTVGFIAFFTNLSFIFPSLGPTAFLHFAAPNKPPSSPKNTFIGHFIGIIAGSLSLQLSFLYNHESILVEGVSINRIFCASTSVALTCCLMVLFKVQHPPSGATTLIVSLGLLKTPIQLICMMSAVIIITLQAFVLNRLFRKDVTYPMWSINLQKNTDSDLNISSMDILTNEMNNLSIDNFFNCFLLCTKLQNEEIMHRLMEFATKYRNDLKMNEEYTKVIPFAVRIAIEREYTPPAIQ